MREFYSFDHDLRYAVLNQALYNSQTGRIRHTGQRMLPLNWVLAVDWRRYDR